MNYKTIIPRPHKSAGSIIRSLASFFTHSTRFQHQLVSQQLQNELQPEQEEPETGKPYQTKRTRKLCFEDHNTNGSLCLNLSSTIHSLCDAKCFAQAHHRFLLSLASGCIPDDRTCNILIARLLGSRIPHMTLHALFYLCSAKPDFVPHLISYNCLIHQLCSCSRPSEAHRLFFDMKSRGLYPNVVTYTTLINGYCSAGNVGCAQKVFDEMGEKGVVPNSLTYSVLISGVLRKRDIEHGRELMCKLWDNMKGGEETAVKSAAFTNLVDSLCRERYFHEVFTIAEAMPQGKTVLEEFAFAQMIDSLCKAGKYHGASRIVYIMRKKGFIPSLVSYNSIVHGLSREGGCMRAYQMVEEGINFGYFPAEHTYKVLVESLCSRGSDMLKAKELLDIMLKKEGVDRTRIYNIYLRALCLMCNPTELLNAFLLMLQNQCQPNLITLNTVINGFCKMGRVEDGLSILNDMMTEKFCAPDAVTFTSIISGLLNVGKMQEALGMLHQVMPKFGLKPSVVTYNAVLRGLFKLQCANEAMKVFDSMVTDDVEADSVTYAIIIDGLCEFDQIEEAKRFWDDVIWPSKIHDDYVYAAILKGICRSGRLNEACHFLYELVDSGVSPNIVSYNIVIDNACKMGLNREAYQIVREMKKNGLAPDAVTWRILNKLHTNPGKQFCINCSSTQAEDLDKIEMEA